MQDDAQGRDRDGATLKLLRRLLVSTYDYTDIQTMIAHGKIPDSSRFTLVEQKQMGDRGRQRRGGRRFGREVWEDVWRLRNS